MFRVIILYLWAYLIPIEALLTADTKLMEDEESRGRPYQRNIILTEDEPKQHIQSFGFPYDLYPPNIEIEYNVKVLLSDQLQQMGARIYLYFEMFALELSQSCRNDGFRVLDITTRQLRVYCGSETGRTLVSEGDSLNLRFFSNSKYEERGYRIQLAILPSTCSQEFIGRDMGKFNSPNYPEKYIKDDICIWRIVAPEGKYVRLKFESSFDVTSPDEKCRQDSVQVSASGNTKKKFKRYCGTTAPGVIDSFTNIMIVKFRSDSFFEGKGFNATFGVIELDFPPTPPPIVIPQECGRSFVSEESRIVGGDVVHPPHLYPWMAGLVSFRLLLFCGATLISDQYLLTAAHCIAELSPSVFRVVLGAQESNITSESILLPVRDIIVHEKYYQQYGFNDIAIIRLSEKVIMTNEVYPLCLPIKDYDTDDITAIVTGWGDIKQNVANKQKLLRHVTVPIVSNARCVDIYGGMVLETSICAGEIGKDACGTDSGGPLFTKISDNRWMMIGIVSWGQRCADPVKPGVYVRVSEYLDWIYGHTGDLSNDTTYGTTMEPTLSQLPSPPVSNIKDCGIPNSLADSRIIGGKETGLFKFPWIALISSNESVLGVGSLVNRRYVLTAFSSVPLWLIKNPEYIDVYLVEHNLTQTEPYTKAHKVVRVIVYSRYGAIVLYDYDFAILELLLDEDLPQEFRPICIPAYNMEIPDGTDLIVAAWRNFSTSMT